MKSHEQIKQELNNLFHIVKSIGETYFDNLSVILINYYNVLSALTDDTDTPQRQKNKLINELYEKFQEKSLDELTNMLGEVYTITSASLKEIYEINEELPISKIEFYNKDGITIDERWKKWFHPKSQNYLIDKLQALNKVKQICRSECINEMNIVEYDKLFNNCTIFEIYNEDEEEDCDENVHCEIYWGEYKVTDELPPMPSYHPDCECHVAYYFD